MLTYGLISPYTDHLDCCECQLKNVCLSRQRMSGLQVVQRNSKSLDLDAGLLSASLSLIECCKTNESYERIRTGCIRRDTAEQEKRQDETQFCSLKTKSISDRNGY